MSTQEERDEAREYMRCMGIKANGERCTRRYAYGRLVGGRTVYCRAHARMARWRLW